jgi:FKBP-type peptidyl-prolyl cis-trans isomerase
MKLFYYPIFLILVIIGLASCEQKAKEIISEEGIRYVHHIHNEGIPIDSGNVVEFQLKIYDYKDSLLKDSYTEGAPFPLATQVIPNNPFKDVLFKIADGDSLTVFLPIEEKEGQPLLPFLKVGTDLRHEIKILKIYSAEEYQKLNQERMVQRQKEIQEKMEKQKGLDDKIIAEHLATKGLSDKAQKTESGLYYVIEQEGEGEVPTAGKKVIVHYNGTLLDGKKFDASYDRNEPLPFILGQKQVIAGWDEGFALLKKGAKATLYIPSHLAYGPQKRGEVIKPFSILKFDVELLDITENDTEKK